MEAVWRLEEGEWRTQLQRRDVVIRRRADLHEPNVAMSRRHQDLIREILRYKAEAVSFEGGGEWTRTEEDACVSQEIVCTIVFVFLFLNI